MSDDLEFLSSDQYKGDAEGSFEEDVGGGAMPSGGARIAGLHLELSIRGYVDVAKLTGATLPEWGKSGDWERTRREFAIRGIAAAEALEAAIEAEVPGFQIRVRAELEPNFDTAGPGALPPPIFELFVGDDPIGRIADYIGIAEGLRKLFGWLKGRGADPLTVDNGTAMILAAGAIFGNTSERDLTLNFVEEIRPAVRDWEGQVEGYLVGFRNESTIFEVPVMLDGSVGEMIVLPIPSPRASRGPLGTGWCVCCAG